ncbi:hypothetical protein NL676_020200 [Syzygium grande]|nr:hypothetical protein NL676_020200 [Syzygium grande]
MISGDQISRPHHLLAQLHQYRHNLLDGLNHHFRPLLCALGLVLQSGAGGTAKRSTRTTRREEEEEEEDLGISRREEMKEKRVTQA